MLQVRTIVLYGIIWLNAASSETILGVAKGQHPTPIGCLIVALQSRLCIYYFLPPPCIPATEHLICAANIAHSPVALTLLAPFLALFAPTTGANSNAAIAAISAREAHPRMHPRRCTRSVLAAANSGKMTPCSPLRSARKWPLLGRAAPSSQLVANAMW